MEYPVIYILGRGRSGSTVLDAVLGNAPQVQSVGEVVVGLHNFPEELCSNGETIAESSFWSQVISRIEDMAGVNIKTFAEKLYHHAHLKNFVPTFFSSKSKSSIKELRKFNDTLYEAIHEVAAKSIVVDSVPGPFSTSSPIPTLGAQPDRVCFFIHPPNRHGFQVPFSPCGGDVENSKFSPP
jgi:hypothetical protein